MKRPVPTTDSSLTKVSVTEDKSSKSENSNNSIDLENWMSNLPSHLTRIPLIYLAIPGSHNSFSYSLSPNSEISPDSPEIVQQLSKWFKPLANRIVYNWSSGQKVNVTTQLKFGIRYFDIRLVYKNGDIYISHGLYGGNIEKFLQEISAFLNSHQKEVVILDCQHFYKFNMPNHQHMGNIFQQIFGGKICRRRVLMKDINLEQLWNDGCQVIIIYRHSYVNYNDLCWPSGSWITAWPNKIKTSDLLNYLDNGIANRRADVGYVSQGILTPTVKYVVLHIGSSLKKLALRNNQKLATWLDTKSNGRHGLNVVICDFVESYAFCDKVIHLNYKNLENNKSVMNPDEELRSELN